jgi:hypothetical protein
MTIRSTGWSGTSLTKSKKDGGLGYKDLHAFNMAMLAKQAWRLLMDPDSLCARVLKARYFPNTSILEVEPKEGISYTWRSILKGVQLLSQGVIWRVGDGSTINMWQDPWIPRSWSRQPVTARGQQVYTMLKDLLDTWCVEWATGVRHFSCLGCLDHKSLACLWGCGRLLGLALCF